MTNEKAEVRRDWLLELRTVDNEDQFKDIADIALRANFELQHEILLLARGDLERRHNGDLEQWVIDTVHDIQRERAEARKEELAKARALAPKLHEPDVAAQVNRVAKPQPEEPKSEVAAPAPGRALVPINHGGPIRFGRATEGAKIFSPPTQPVRADPEPEQPEEQPQAEPVKSGTGLQTEVAQPQSEFGFSPPAELPLPEAIKTMNDKHAVITNLGGKCVTMEWTPSLIMPGTKELAYQSFSSFRERYANRYVDCGMGMGRANLAAVWLAHPQRRQYEGLDLVPNGAGYCPGATSTSGVVGALSHAKAVGDGYSGISRKCWQTAIRSSRITSRDGRLGNSRMQVCPPRS